MLTSASGGGGGTTGPAWLLGLSFAVSFVLAFGIGANGVATSFATAVGSRTLTVFQACLYATFAEFLGALLLGGEAAATIQRDVIHGDLYADAPLELMLGMATTLTSTALWLIVATHFKLPVSAIHAMVAGIVGFTLVARGASGVNWWELGRIIISCVLSPLLAGAVSIGVYKFLRWGMLNKNHPFEAGLRLIPYIYAFTVGISLFPIVLQIMAAVGEAYPYLSNELCDQIAVCLSAWLGTVVASAVGIVVGVGTAVLVHYWIVPRTRSNVVQQETFALEDQMELLPVSYMPTPSRDELTTVENEDDVTECQYDNMPQNGLDEITLSTTAKSTDTVEELDPATLRPPTVQLALIGSSAPSTATVWPPISTYEIDESTLEVDQDSINSETTAPPFDLAADDDRSSLISSNTPRPLQCLTSCLPRPPRTRMEAVSVTSDNEAAQTEKLFTSLQVLTAVFASLVHGSNDIGIAIGPLALVLAIWWTGEVTTVSYIPTWILAFGGLGIVVGLIGWGRRVIETLGNGLTVLTPSRGFTIEFGSAITVLLASRIGLPLNTAQAKVGAIVAVGYWSNDGAVSWRLFGTIAAMWAVTIPGSMALSAMLYASLRGTMPTSSDPVM